jgi:hypothetical protein
MRRMEPKASPTSATVPSHLPVTRSPPPGRHLAARVVTPPQWTPTRRPPRPSARRVLIPGWPAAARKPAQPPAARKPAQPPATRKPTPAQPTATRMLRPGPAAAATGQAGRVRPKGRKPARLRRRPFQRPVLPVQERNPRSPDARRFPVPPGRARTPDPKGRTTKADSAPGQDRRAWRTSPRPAPAWRRTVRRLTNLLESLRSARLPGSGLSGAPRPRPGRLPDRIPQRASRPRKNLPYHRNQQWANRPQRELQHHWNQQRANRPQKGLLHDPDPHGLTVPRTALRPGPDPQLATRPRKEPLPGPARKRWGREAAARSRGRDSPEPTAAAEPARERRHGPTSTRQGAPELPNRTYPASAIRAGPTPGRRVQSAPENRGRPASVRRKRLRAGAPKVRVAAGNQSHGTRTREARPAWIRTPHLRRAHPAATGKGAAARPMAEARSPGRTTTRKCVKPRQRPNCSGMTEIWMASRRLAYPLQGGVANPTRRVRPDCHVNLASSHAPPRPWRQT